jgi:ankyrin repeat protein
MGVVVLSEYKNIYIFLIYKRILLENPSNNRPPPPPFFYSNNFNNSNHSNDSESPIELVHNSQLKTKKVIALSKLLEYPPNLEEVIGLLRLNFSTTHESFYDINGKDMFGLTALHKAAAWDAMELLNVLLETADINVNQQSHSFENNGFTALHFAIDANSVRAVRRLLVTHE